MRACCICGTLTQNKRACSRACHDSWMRKKGRRHSAETRQKIAQGNSGKRFSEHRRRNISLAKTTTVSVEVMEDLQRLWSLRYLNPKVIIELTRLGPRVYRRLKDSHCEVEQIGFMPSDWYPEDYRKLIELSEQGIWYAEIARQMGRGRKQIRSIQKKLGLPINTRDPDAYSCTSSKIELMVGDWLSEGGIQHSTQYQLGNFYFDFHITGTNKLIEVHGDYWHCNPRVYVDGPINDMQRRALRRDFAKLGIASRAGYRRYLLWENALRLSPETQRQRLLEFINE